MFSKLCPSSGVDRVEPASPHLLGTVAEVIPVVGQEIEPFAQLFGEIVARMAGNQGCHKRGGE
jgi:hypothetical protein